ncbi:MAG: hypothetical protein CSA33_04440 [Desulfobulbus propionicus]|nr:MAG: hypothetical protein CSA33_04440 [Desulfobulbus propionicus]
MNFFDQYQRFYVTSETSPFPHRLNGRYRAIIEKNADRIAGSRVLDIASHDGRWSFAALQAGARHVTGVEPRQELIENAHQSFAHYGMEKKQYDFICGDVFTAITNQQFDVVLCLGFFYHTTRHPELLAMIDRTGARLVIIDTEVTPLEDEIPVVPNNHPRMIYKNPFVVQLLKDEVGDQQMACQDAMTRDGYTLVARPSRAATLYLAEHFGYCVTMYDWPEHFDAYPEHAEYMTDYKGRWRETFYLSKTE